MSLLRAQDLMNDEAQRLKPYAVKSLESQGRAHPEEKDEQRTPYQRDRDRVIHSRSFRRLQGKTQVFVAQSGDHYRNRLTHTLEVAQIARDLCRNLGLNEDLAETVALSHDLGHTPFGHAGEKALDELLHRYGKSFEHNQQSRRIVDTLERYSPLYKGLNLSWEVRMGLNKHRDFVGEDSAPLSLEAQVVDWSDKIAYISHDIDDGVRGGVVMPEELERTQLWKMAIEHSRGAESEDLALQQARSSLTKILTEKLLASTVENLGKQKISSLEEVYQQRQPLADFSEEDKDAIQELYHFLQAKLYYDPLRRAESERGQSIIKKLFFALLEKPSQLPEEYLTQYLQKEEVLEILLADYISGMTDSYAITYATGL